MRISFCFRDWNELLVDTDLTGTGEQRVATTLAGSLAAGSSAPVLSNVHVWANYAIVSNDERKRMACAPRDILIEQVQTAPRHVFNPTTNPTPSYDVRFSHAIKVLFFAVRNTTSASDWSVYLNSSPVSTGAGVTTFAQANSVDPILQTSLVYENTSRLNQMGSDYFSLVNPYYHAPVIPQNAGYHTYSYSLDFINLDPMGSTNYGKLTNVSISPEASAGAITAAVGGGAAGSGFDFNQNFEFIVTAVNNNIIRVSGGALGFPVL
jgi:hypothetical protein